MDILLFIRKSEELGINFWLRLIAMGLAVSLLFLVTYYFLIINRDAQLDQPATVTTTQPENEKRKADAALAASIKSALAQTIRLQNYTISVENKDGVITLYGEVASPIDRDFAAEVARKAASDKTINNQIQLVGNTPTTLQPNEIKPKQLNVEDLELEADVREILHATNDAKIQAIKVEVHNRNVKLTGAVESAQQKTRIEQLVRTIPKIDSVDNQVRIGN